MKCATSEVGTSHKGHTWTRSSLQSVIDLSVAVFTKRVGRVTSMHHKHSVVHFQLRNNFQDSSRIFAMLLDCNFEIDLLFNGSKKWFDWFQTTGTPTVEEMKFAGKFCLSSLSMNDLRHVWFRFYGIAEVVGFPEIRRVTQLLKSMVTWCK